MIRSLTYLLSHSTNVSGWPTSTCARHSASSAAQLETWLRPGGRETHVQGSHTSTKGQAAGTVGFVGPMVSVTATRSAVVVKKQAIDHT